MEDSNPFPTRWAQETTHEKLLLETRVISCSFPRIDVAKYRWVTSSTNISKCKLKTCPYCTKTCPHWTCFGTNYPKNGVGLALTLDKNFKFSKVLLSPKFKHNSMSMAVKKKILYYIVYHTLEWNFDPIESKDKHEAEIFFPHCHTHCIVLEFWGK